MDSIIDALDVTVDDMVGEEVRVIEGVAELVGVLVGVKDTVELLVSDALDVIDHESVVEDDVDNVESGVDRAVGDDDDEEEGGDNGVPVPEIKGVSVSDAPRLNVVLDVAEILELVLDVMLGVSLEVGLGDSDDEGVVVVVSLDVSVGEIVEAGDDINVSVILALPPTETVDGGVEDGESVGVGVTLIEGVSVPEFDLVEVTVAEGDDTVL